MPPRAARKGKAIAPPMRIRSAAVIRLPIASNLSATLAPPSTTTYGRRMSAVSRLSAATSAWTR